MGLVITILVYQILLEVSAGSKKADNVFINGVSQSYFDVKELEILAGRKFMPNDYSRYSRIMMLDVNLAEKTFR